MKGRAIALLVLAGCARPAQAPEPAPALRAPNAAPIATATAITIAAGTKAPWREPAMVTTPRHPLADARLVTATGDKATIQTVNALVSVLRAGGVESVKQTPREGRPRSDAVCVEALRFAVSWERLVEPTSLAARRVPLAPPRATACTPTGDSGGVRRAIGGDETVPCAFADCVRGTTDPEPELTRTHLALLPGRCAPEDADDSGACRAGARTTHEPDAVLADLEERGVTVLPAPAGCHPARALAVGGLPLLLCSGGPTGLFAAHADGTWRSEGTLPVRDGELGGAALGADGTLLLRASWDEPTRRRAFVRAPGAAGEPSLWREIALGDALDVRVAPGGGVLVIRSLDGGRALAIDLDRERGRAVLAARIPLDLHLVDVAIERGKLVLFLLPRMNRGRPTAGSPAARGAAEAFAVLEGGGLEKLPSAP